MIAVGEDAVDNGSKASAGTEIFLEDGDGLGAIDEGVLVDEDGGPGVLDAHALSAANDEVVAKDDGRALAHRDAFVGVVKDGVSCDEAIDALLASVDAVAVEALEIVDAAVFDNTVDHTIVVDGIGVRGGVSGEGTAEGFGASLFDVETVTGEGDGDD